MAMQEAYERFTIDGARAFARDLCLAKGASHAVADSLADATVSAECHGGYGVGFAHLVDYLKGFDSGLINAQSEPTIEVVAPAMIRSDAALGIAQLGFDRAFSSLCENAKINGVTLFAQRNGYTCGELGYYTRRLASQGLVAFAVTNACALLTVAGQPRPMYSTNPLAFAAPIGEHDAVLIDQASSATAFVNIIKAAESGQSIPAGWAVDSEGKETLSASEALNGALLAFGGARGANIALMVEVLAAGVTGASWSLDSPDFRTGTTSPDSGLLVIAIAPRLLDPDFEQRLARQVQRLAAMGVYVPGHEKITALRDAKRNGLALPIELVRKLQRV